MALRCACIDIGTNTTRLLVADQVTGGLQTVAVARTFVPLGAGTLASTPLQQTADALVAAVTGHLATAREHGADVIRVVGTAALRTGRHADGLCAVVRAAGGAVVEVLHPREEARLAFLGVVGTLASPPAGGEEIAVIDIGGGSVEVVVGSVDGGMGWWTSVPIGSAVLTAAHLHSDPPTAAEVDAVRVAAAHALTLPDVPSAGAVYVVGGTGASLSRIVGGRVTAEAAERAVTLLTAGRAADVAVEHALDERRVRVLAAGILLVAAAGRALGSAPIVARGGLREGVVLDAR